MRYPHEFSAFRICIALSLLLAAAANANPAVTNVVASQRADGTGLVDIYYNLSGADGSVIVDVTFSNNNGASWNVLPTASLLSGDVGSGITNGANKHIVWDVPRDRAGVNWPNTRARVTASELGNTITLQLPGGVPLEMVEIPPGTFTMGSGLDPDYSDENEAPQHTVNIDYEFYMGKFEVTQAQWYAVMGSNPSSYEGVDRPVERVSWNDCQEFIAALNDLDIGTFRLPTEAEWEYACRAGSTGRWYFGNDEALLTNYAWYGGNNEPYGTKVVGLKPPNGFGLYDMHGNVWEWVQDWFHSNYQGAPVDGSAWEDPAGDSRVLRGGAFYNVAEACRSADRLDDSPGNRYYLHRGVRLVRTP